MAYIKPSADSDDLASLSVDSVYTKANAQIVSTSAGFGVIDPYTGQVEILDGLPLNRSEVQTSIAAGAAAIGRPDPLTDSDLKPGVDFDSDLYGLVDSDYV